MTIAFPRDMPAVGVGAQVFEPFQVNLESGESGGSSYGVGLGLPRWRGEWTLARAITDLQSDEWRAFLASLKGAQRTFLGRDVERPFPRLYKAGFAGLVRAGTATTFDGSLTSWSQTIGADGQALVTLNGLPDGLKLSTGDYCDFRFTTSGVARRAMVRSLENATANSSGVIAGLSVEPPIPASTPGGAVGHLDNPACVMRLVSAETKVTEMDRRRVAGARVVAFQDLRV